MPEDLREFNAAADQYAIENNKGSGGAFTWTDLQPYIKAGTPLYNAMIPTGGNPGVNPLDMLGNTYRACTATIDQPAPGCADVCLNPNTFASLSDVAPASFWSGYGIAPTP